MKRLQKFLVQINFIPCKVKNFKKITILYYMNGNCKTITTAK
jgi:hypothetical protein